MRCGFCGRGPIRKSPSFLRHKLALQKMLVATNKYLGVSKVRLSAVTGLSRPTIYKLIKDYIHEWDM